MTSDTMPVFNTTYTHAPTVISAAAELEPSHAGNACAAQYAAAVQTVRHAPLKKTCTAFGLCSGLHSDCTSAPPKPISTVSLKLKSARPIKMKTKFVEIEVFSPGSRIFIVEATIASAKNTTYSPEFAGFHW